MTRWRRVSDGSTGLTSGRIDAVTSANRLEDLRLEARYQRERLQLYRAKVQSSRPTTLAHLRQRERECEFAERRLRGAQQELAR
jgi:hypothetical protein